MYKRGAAYASCLLIEGGLQIPRFHRSNVFLQRIANPLGRLTEDRRLTEIPWFHRSNIF